MENIKKKRTDKFIVVLFLTLYILSTELLAYERQDTQIEDNKIYKIGVNALNPYLSENKQGKVSGYYNEITKFIENELNIKFYIEVDDFSNNLKKLTNGELDLLIGIPYIEEEKNNILYSQYYIGFNNQRLYSKNNVKYSDLKNLKEVNIVVVEDVFGVEWLTKSLENLNINFKFKLVSDDHEAKKLINNNEANLILTSSHDEKYKKFNKVYEYNDGPIYIAASNKNEAIIANVNEILLKSINSKENPIEKIYGKHFRKIYVDPNLYPEIIKFMFSFTLLLLLFIYVKNIYPKIKIFRIKNKINIRMKKNQYMLHYQPIINPKLETLVGFEALLRLNTKKGLIYPNEFLKEIEESKMLSEVSYWILKKVIIEYKLIREEINYKYDSFYISINISLNEIENELFVDNMIVIFNNSKLPRNSICLEITENVGIGNLEKLKIVLSKLKECGFMIAIDDFGVEYSTLEIIEKLDFDIIKLDKYFIDKIETSKFRKNAVDFISNFAMDNNKVIIAEGVENKTQKEIIKKYNHDKFYIQGYFYSKPVSITMINKILKINSKEQNL